MARTKTDCIFWETCHQTTCEACVAYTTKAQLHKRPTKTETQPGRSTLPRGPWVESYRKFLAAFERTGKGEF